MGEVKLKACPFCGGKAMEVNDDVTDMHVLYPVHYVGCTVCLAQGPIANVKNKMEAILKWNVRAGREDA